MVQRLSPYLIANSGSKRICRDAGIIKEKTNMTRSRWPDSKVILDLKFQLIQPQPIDITQLYSLTVVPNCSQLGLHGRKCVSNGRGNWIDEASNHVRKQRPRITISEKIHSRRQRYYAPQKIPKRHKMRPKIDHLRKTKAHLNKLKTTAPLELTPRRNPAILPHYWVRNNREDFGLPMPLETGSRKLYSALWSAGERRGRRTFRHAASTSPSTSRRDRPKLRLQNAYRELTKIMTNEKSGSMRNGWRKRQEGR